MNEYHRAKNIFGELTFGEYWNLVGCHAGAFKINGSKSFDSKIEVDEKGVKLFLNNSFAADGRPFFYAISFEAKVKAARNKVVIPTHSRKEMVVEFFELVPLDFDPIAIE